VILTLVFVTHVFDLKRWDRSGPTCSQLFVLGLRLLGQGRQIQATVTRTLAAIAPERNPSPRPLVKKLSDTGKRETPDLTIKQPRRKKRPRQTKREENRQRAWTWLHDTTLERVKQFHATLPGHTRSFAVRSLIERGLAAENTPLRDLLVHTRARFDTLEQRPTKPNWPPLPAQLDLSVDAALSFAKTLDGWFDETIEFLSLEIECLTAELKANAKPKKRETDEPKEQPDRLEFVAKAKADWADKALFDRLRIKLACASRLAWTLRDKRRSRARQLDTAETTHAHDQLGCELAALENRLLWV